MINVLKDAINHGSIAPWSSYAREKVGNTLNKQNVNKPMQRAWYSLAVNK